MLAEGSEAPNFDLPSTAGGTRSLADFRGKKLVLFFYPKDDTPGCTREACGFRDEYGLIRKSGAEVVGVSKDALGSHEKFRTKYELPFELLSDADNAVSRAYGAFGEKNMYGRKVMGTIRSTVVIDEQGTIERVWSPVRVDGHVDAVLAHLRGEPEAKKKIARKKATKKKTARNTSTSVGGSKKAPARARKKT